MHPNWPCVLTVTPTTIDRCISIPTKPLPARSERLDSRWQHDPSRSTRSDPLSGQWEVVWEPGISDLHARLYMLFSPKSFINTALHAIVVVATYGYLWPPPSVRRGLPRAPWARPQPARQLAGRQTARVGCDEPAGHIPIVVNHHQFRQNACQPRTQRHVGVVELEEWHP
jgi:hypothetical protein